MKNQNRRYIVTFDIDNTLIRSSIGHEAAMLTAIKDIYGVKASMDIIRHHGMTDPEIVIRILEKCGVNDQVIRSKLNECLDWMQQRYNDFVLSEEIVLLGGVSDLLNRLEQEGFILGLVTGNMKNIADAKLKKIGIDGFFQFGGFGSDHIDRTELIKIAIRRAKHQFGLADNLQAFHIGDASQDMMAARGGNAIPIGVTTGVFSADELKSAGAYRIVPNLENTDQILRLLVI